MEPMPPGPKNPYNSGAIVRETDLKTVHQAQRDISIEKGRIWKFKNPSKLNPVTGA